MSSHLQQNFWGWSVLRDFLKAGVNKIPEVFRPRVIGEWGRDGKSTSQAVSPYCLTPGPRNPSPHQCPDWSTGDSFCAMWYKALIAFMLNNGGFRSATERDQGRKGESWQVGRGDWNGNQKTWFTPQLPDFFAAWPWTIPIILINPSIKCNTHPLPCAQWNRDLRK